MNVFGPVPSRRLGKSLGINNIPPKICTYTCVYCQLGKSLKMIAARQEFYSPDELLKEVEEKLSNAEAHGEKIDYLTIVPDGEPTLDIRLGELIQKLKLLRIKTAIITNSTLMDVPEVRDDLMNADWVSVKVDAVDESIWRKIDRPHKKIRLDTMLEGIATFAKAFRGRLVTETMLVKEVNDGSESIRQVAEFIEKIKPAIAYLSIPTRPPADKWVLPPDEHQLNKAFQLFAERLAHVEYLIGYEGNTFAFTGNIEEDILSITSVHPMREEAIVEYLKKANGEFAIIDRLVAEDKLVVSEYDGKRFYLRKLTRRNVR